MRFPYEAVRTNRLPCLRVGRHIRFTREMLEAWLAEQAAWRIAGVGFTQETQGLRCERCGVESRWESVLEPLLAARRRLTS